MSKKYLDIKKRLKFEVVKETGNDLAYLTHYFQNHKNGISQYFKPSAEKYLYNLHEKLKLFEEPDFQYYLPIQWDIPFPPTKNPKFNFIDLFAGCGGLSEGFLQLGFKGLFHIDIEEKACETLSHRLKDYGEEFSQIKEKVLNYDLTNHNNIDT